MQAGGDSEVNREEFISVVIDVLNGVDTEYCIGQPCISCSNEMVEKILKAADEYYDGSGG